MANKIGAIVLAAGFSNRYGSVKLCAELENGETVFSQTVQRIRAAVASVLVVTRPALAELLADKHEQIQVFEHAERGMGATLAFGVGQVSDWDGALICLADMPFIQTSTYTELAQQLNPDNIIIPVHQSQAGNPVGFGRHFFPGLMQLSGDSGGRPVVQHNRESVTEIEIDDPCILHDIDTPGDLARLQASNKTSG